MASESWMPIARDTQKCAYYFLTATKNKNWANFNGYESVLVGWWKPENKKL